MEIPIDIMENFIEDFVIVKQLRVREAGGPANVDMTFVLDFGTTYKDWPFYDAVKVKAEFDMDGDSDDNLLAVASMPNDRTEITLFFTRMMTMFGPPAWAGVICDSYERILTPKQVDELKAGEWAPGRGDLEREFEENPLTDIHEAITAEAIHVNGDRVSWRQRFFYNDQGQIVFEERERREATLKAAYGFLAELLSRVVELHGKEPYDILITLAQGNEEEVAAMWAAYNRQN